MMERRQAVAEVAHHQDQTEVHLHYLAGFLIQPIQSRNQKWLLVECYIQNGRVFCD